MSQQKLDALLKKNSGLCNKVENTYVNAASSVILGALGIFALSAVASSFATNKNLFSKDNLSCPLTLYIAGAAVLALGLIGGISAMIGEKQKKGDDKEYMKAAAKGGCAAIGALNPIQLLQEVVYEPFYSASAAK